MESTGHCHPRVVKAIQEQAAQLIHSQQNIFTSNVAQVEYCQYVHSALSASTMPSPLVILACS